jgi:hypothetical protein
MTLLYWIRQWYFLHTGCVGYIAIAWPSGISSIPDVLVTSPWPGLLEFPPYRMCWFLRHGLAFWHFLHVKHCGLHLHKSTLRIYLVIFLAQGVLPPIIFVMEFGNDIFLSLKALLYNLQYILRTVIGPNVMIMPNSSCDCGTIRIRPRNSAQLHHQRKCKKLLKVALSTR